RILTRDWVAYVTVTGQAYKSYKWQEIKHGSELTTLPALARRLVPWYSLPLQPPRRHTSFEERSRCISAALQSSRDCWREQQPVSRAMAGGPENGVLVIWKARRDRHTEHHGLGGRQYGASETDGETIQTQDNPSAPRFGTVDAVLNSLAAPSSQV